MSSQSGEFSCVEMSWEESSTKCKNYYGVVEEPREERIIPIKIDRGISIHTASDEEEEPFWIVESVKKNEQVRNEIKNMKEHKNSRGSLSDSLFEDEDNSLNDLLKRVKKQRNDLEDILEKENNNNAFEVNYSEQISSQSSSRLSELSALDAKSISGISNTHIKHKKEYSSITENISNELMYSTMKNVNRPKNGCITNQLPTDMTENYSSFETENLDTKYSKYEDDNLNTIKKASISRVSSKEERDNVFSPQKTINEYPEKPKKGSLSRLSSIEEHNNSSVSTKIIFNEYSDKSKRGSLSSTEGSIQDFTLNKTISYDTKLEKSNIEFIENGSISKSLCLDEHEKNNNILNSELKTIEEQNLNDSSNNPNVAKNDNLNNVNNIAKILDNGDLNESNTINMSKLDDADTRRKSLIKQSSMLSDALNAMCSEIPADSTYNKLKRLSLEDKIDDKYNDYNLKAKNENGLLRTPIKQSSLESSSFDESKIQDSSNKKSSVSYITDQKNCVDLENNKNESTPKLNDDIIVSVSNNEINDIDINQKKFDGFENGDLISKKTDLKETPDITPHISNDLIPKSMSTRANTSQPLNENVLNDRELQSTPNSLSKNNNMDVLPKESISSNDVNFNNAEKSLRSDKSIVEGTNIKILEQPSEDTMNKENEKNCKSKTTDATNEANGNNSTCGIKNIGGIQNIRCNNNVSVVFFLFVQKSSLFRLSKLYIILINIPRQ